MLANRRKNWILVLGSGLLLLLGGVAQGSDDVRTTTGARTGADLRTTTGARGTATPVIHTTGTTIGGTRLRAGYHFVESEFGSGLVLVPGRGKSHWSWGCWSGVGWGWGWGWPGRTVWRDTSWSGPPLVEITRRLDPALLGLSTEERAPAAPVDPGLDALASGSWTRALAVYLQRAEEQRRREAEDSEVERDRSDLRLAAFSLAGDGQFDRAERLFAEAYSEDPGLNDRAMSGEALGVRATELRRMVTRAVAHAHRVDRPDAWLMVAVLMQAEGRDDLARQMLKRAQGSSAVAIPAVEPKSGEGAERAPDPAEDDDEG